MEDEEYHDIISRIEQAANRSRGYASYWEWAPDRQQHEAHVASALAQFLALNHDEKWDRIVPLNDDPPDILAVSVSGVRIGVEITELVDSTAVERGRYAKKKGTKIDYWADWTAAQVTEKIDDIIEKKQEKLRTRCRDFDELILAIVTDEPMISVQMAEAASRAICHSVEIFRRVFFLLSYKPGMDEKRFPSGIPVFLLPSK